MEETTSLQACPPPENNQDWRTQKLEEACAQLRAENRLALALIKRERAWQEAHEKQKQQKRPG